MIVEELDRLAGLVDCAGERDADGLSKGVNLAGVHVAGDLLDEIGERLLRAGIADLRPSYP
jgi:hypothetical protein